jgi:hypothetical protein
MKSTKIHLSIAPDMYPFISDKISQYTSARSAAFQIKEAAEKWLACEQNRHIAAFPKATGQADAPSNIRPSMVVQQEKKLHFRWDLVRRCWLRVTDPKH